MTASNTQTTVRAVHPWSLLSQNLLKSVLKKISVTQRQRISLPTGFTATCLFLPLQQEGQGTLLSVRQVTVASDCHPAWAPRWELTLSPVKVNPYVQRS